MEEFNIPLEIPCVYYDESFMSQEEANAAYQDLHQHTKWESTSKINRWVALHEEDDDNDEGDAGQYKYRDAPDSSDPAKPRQPFSATIKSICEKAETWYNSKHAVAAATKESKEGGEEKEDPGSSFQPVKFNVCLLNYYEDGNQRIGWHSDREEIGRTTPIASISLGASREFQIRAKEGLERTSILLKSGSLTIMENICQMKYVHCIPKMANVTEGRINLTFRCKTADTAGEEEHERRDKWLERITDIKSSSNNNEAMQYPTYSQALADGQDAGHVPVFGDMVGTDEERDDKLSEMNVIFTVKTHVGAEIFSAAEVDELVNGTLDDNGEKLFDVIPRPWAAAGYVAIGRRQEDSGADVTTNQAIQQSARTALLKLRSAQYVMEYHDHFDLEDVAEDRSIEVAAIVGEDLYQFYKKRLLEGVAKIPSLEAGSKKNKTTFRVTCERIGAGHNFKAPNVEFEIGGAMSEYFNNVKPKMEDYDVNIRVDVVGTHVIVGTQQNFEDLSRRHFVRFRNKVTIKANVAYMMFRCANLQPNQVLLDPFCGSGTILLEALEVDPSLRCIGIDVNRKSVQGAEENAKAVGQAHACRFHCIDVRAFRKHVAEESVDALVSNLPWGVMTGQKKSVSDLQAFYEMFLRTAWYVLKPYGRVVMLVLRGLQMTRIIRKLSGRYRILRVIVIRTTNNLPCIVVIEKLPRDVLNDSIKGQLAYMAGFVNVSREMYHAIHNEDIASGVDVPDTYHITQRNNAGNN